MDELEGVYFSSRKEELRIQLRRMDNDVALEMHREQRARDKRQILALALTLAGFAMNYRNAPDCDFLALAP